jgi:hypothetical protein
MTQPTTDIPGVHQTYRIYQQPVASGGRGEIFGTVDGLTVVKRFREPQSVGANRLRMEHLVQMGRRTFIDAKRPFGSDVESSILWPTDLIIRDDKIYGIAMPRITKEFFGGPDGQLLDAQFLYLKRASPPPAEERVDVLIQVARVMDWLRDKKLVHGDFTHKNVVWSRRSRTAPNRVLLIDTDGLHDEKFLSSDNAATAYWTDPRLSSGRIKRHDLYSDAYALGLLMYRGLYLTPGNIGPNNPPKIRTGTPPQLASLMRTAFESDQHPELRPEPQRWSTELQAAFGTALSNRNTAQLEQLDRVAGYGMRQPDPKTVTKQRSGTYRWSAATSSSPSSTATGKPTPQSTPSTPPSTSTPPRPGPAPSHQRTAAQRQNRIFLISLAAIAVILLVWLALVSAEDTAAGPDTTFADSSLPLRSPPTTARDDDSQTIDVPAPSTEAASPIVTPSTRRQASTTRVPVQTRPPIIEASTPPPPLTRPPARFTPRVGVNFDADVFGAELFDEERYTSGEAITESELADAENERRRSNVRLVIDDGASIDTGSVSRAGLAADRFWSTERGVYLFSPQSASFGTEQNAGVVGVLVLNPDSYSYCGLRIDLTLKEDGRSILNAYPIQFPEETAIPARSAFVSVVKLSSRSLKGAINSPSFEWRSHWTLCP